jgi:hypothetical protein
MPGRGGTGLLGTVLAAGGYQPSSPSRLSSMPK